MTASHDLNNYLQEKQQSSLLAWVEQSSGPSHETTWTVQCKGSYNFSLFDKNKYLRIADLLVDGQVLGTGKAATKQAAKDVAARQALQVLQSA
ncbi:hypothetical protein BDQ17DRAFT_860878 [Cyathus striatus]|nr:hypothetical protein BDQ17DRAFT_860878 [Cyathus striatus]